MLHSASWTAAAAVTLALSLLVSAIPQSEDENASIVVPLRKRTSFVKSDGTFDLELAVEHAVSVKNKHRQNLINLERNVGKEAFNPVSITSDQRLIPSLIFFVGLRAQRLKLSHPSRNVFISDRPKRSQTRKTI